MLFLYAVNSLAKTQRTAGVRGRLPLGALSAVETDVVEFFVGIAQTFGLPRSIGEVYGLLFLTPSPLTTEDIVSRLKISKGSASQGLKALRSANAVNPVYVPRDRRAHFVAEVELRSLIQGFLRERIAPSIFCGTQRLSRLDKDMAALTENQRDKFQGRVEKLQSWRRQASAIFPAIIAAVES
jgi:DNA-binding transcriptional regulator GbsR (MarR family)